MPTTDDLTQHANSTTDFYALLDLPLASASSESEIRRAYRKTTLKYHPDKAGAADTLAAEKFQLVQVALEVLTDPAARAAYDAARKGREERERLRSVYEGRRKGMVDELERRERRSGVGVKRGREDGDESGEVDAEERFQRELRRLAEDGRRRRREQDAKRRRESGMFDGTASVESPSPTKQTDTNGATHGPPPTSTSTTTTTTDSTTTTSDLSRTLKLRWSMPSSLSTAPDLSDLLTPFGPITHITPPKHHPSTRKTRDPTATAYVVFESLEGVRAAMISWEAAQKNGRRDEGTWSRFDRVSLVSTGSEDDGNDNTPTSAPSTPPRSHIPSNLTANTTSTSKSFSFTPSPLSASLKPTSKIKGSSTGTGKSKSSLERSVLERLKVAEEKRRSSSGGVVQGGGG
ncbi:MAG: hypothetical protein M1817_005711 [Caeruleum heppii]|nr:MAG: hypothetical protein M1817_005711 [Caeruleum heppii]